jgi:hypothetical protein
VPGRWGCVMRVPRLLVVLLLLGLMVPASAAGARAPAPVTPTLVGIRAAHHPGFDRLVFDFRGGLPADVRARYVDTLIGDFSGLRVPVAGRAVVRLTFRGAQAHTMAGTAATAPSRRAFALPNVMAIAQAGDFEAVLTYGVGLAKQTRFQVFTLRSPDRVVVDVRAAFPTVQRKVWFFAQDRFVDNRQPFFGPRTRPVRPGTPATGVMDRLFAGPQPGERADGLRLLRSRTTGFDDLRINNGIARVRLTGGCSSGGSTVGIAGEIMPTLRQFRSVDWVKIYDPRGRTATPVGPSDSVPFCLEP